MAWLTTSPTGKRAFTLIEVLVVLVIISLMLGVAVPFFRGASQRARLKSALRGVIEVLGRARSLAQLDRTQSRVWLEGDCLRIAIRQNGKWNPVGEEFCLPSGVSARLDQPVEFLHTGEAKERTCVHLWNDLGKQKDVCASSLSGKISVVSPHSR